MTTATSAAEFDALMAAMDDPDQEPYALESYLPYEEPTLETLALLIALREVYADEEEAMLRVYTSHNTQK